MYKLRVSRGISNLLAAAVFFALMTTSLMLAVQYMHRESQAAIVGIAEEKMQHNYIPAPSNMHEYLTSKSIVINGVNPKLVAGVLVIKGKGNPRYYEAENVLSIINDTAFSINKTLADPSSSRVLLVLNDGGIIDLSEKNNGAVNTSGINNNLSVNPEEASLIQSILGVSEAYKLFVEENKSIVNFTVMQLNLPIYVDVKIYNIRGHITWYWWGPDWWVKADYHIIIKVNNNTIDERSGELYVHRTGYVDDAEDYYIMGPTNWITIAKYGDIVFKVRVEADVQLHGGVSTWGQESPNPYGYAGGEIDLECIYTGKGIPVVITKKVNLWNHATPTLENDLYVSKYYKSIGDLYVYYSSSSNIVFYEKHHVAGDSSSYVEQCSLNPYVEMTIAVLE